jgi:ankyrin repeat protein
MKDDRDSEEMFALFLARGVDINAGDPRAKNWTALHTVASEGNVARARLLLKHGARTDVRDQDGRTPLDIARSMLQKHPADPASAEMVQLLEVVERK